MGNDRSIMFGDTIIYDAQRQVTLNLKQWPDIRYYASSSYLQVLKGLNKNCRENLVNVLFSDA